MALAPAVIAAFSNADLEYQYLATVGGTGPTLPDRRMQVYGENEHAYFAAVSLLTPPVPYSLSDHKYAFYKAGSGVTGTLADVARAYWGARI